MKMGMVIVGLFLAFLAFAPSDGVFAQNPFDIQFPISELGNCGSLEECGTYCDNPANINACLAWAESQGIEVGPHDDRKITGPGGCSTEAECDVFCSQSDHQSECIDFAEREGILSPEEASLAREHAGKIGPGGCTSPESCEGYCSQPTHTQECIQYAVDEGFMTQAQAAGALEFLEIGPGHVGPGRVGPHEPDIDEEKARQILETQGGPGGCQTFDECENFCNIPGNDTTCFDFAIEHGLMSGDDIERVRAMMEIEGPGGCIGRDCEVYCEGPGHELECMEFAVDQGFMSQEEFQEAQKFIKAAEDGGPGGCRGRECETFCSDPAHRDECLSFAKEHDLIPAGELEALERIDAKMKDSGGPGRCRSEEECHAYCSDLSNFDECAAFAADTGLLSPDQAKEMLKQFINVEQFGPEGFGPPPGFGPEGFEGGFGPPPGFEGFGPPPGFEGEFNAEFERQFEERFHQFDQYREFFETGEPPPGFVPPSGDFGFPTPGEFPAGVPSSPDGTFGAGGPENNTKIEINKSPAGHSFGIVDPEGIREFSFNPREGSGYGGGIGGCPKEHKGDTAFFAQAGFPLTAVITDCQDNQAEIIVTGEGFFSVGGGTAPSGFPPPGEFPSGFEFPTPDEFPAPGEFPSDFQFPPPGEFPSEFPVPSTGEEDELLRAKLGDANLFNCVASRVGEEKARALRDGTEHFDFVSKEVVIQCKEGLSFPSPEPSPVPEPAPEPGFSVCPAFPTVDQCPFGQKKVVVFESHECGVYYGCEPEDSISFPALCVTCAAPPAGCVYEGGSCATCGTIVCSTTEPFPTETFPTTEPTSSISILDFLASVLSLFLGR